MFANPIPEDINQRHDLIALPHRQDRKTSPEREKLEERLDRLFPSEKLRIVQTEVSQLLHLRWHLITQLIEIRTICAICRLPLLIGAIRYLVVGGIKPHVQFRREELHNLLKRLFGLG